jgi:hypothetical protein
MPHVKKSPAVKQKKTCLNFFSLSSLTLRKTIGIAKKLKLVSNNFRPAGTFTEYINPMQRTTK